MEKVWFILYKWMYQPIKDLSDEKFGKLMKAIFEYQKDWSITELKDETQMAFMFFKNQFDIDNQKYEEICKRRQEVWKLWGRPKKANETKQNQKNQKVFEETKKTYIEKENKIQNKIESKNIYWNEKKVKLNKEEYNKIKDRYWIEVLNQFINKLDLYILQQWKDKYSSHYATILNWISKDWIKEVKEIKKVSFTDLL